MDNFRSVGLVSTWKNTEYGYQVGGSLPLDSPTYVTRSTDREFLQGLQAGEFCYVLSSRQVGKSSLRVRMMQRLQENGYVCATLDLTAIGSQDITLPQWYAGFTYSLADSFNLLEKYDFCRWWMSRDSLSPLLRLERFIEEVLLKEIGQKIVIFIDEIDNILSLKFSLDEFFCLIERCYRKRSENADYQRLSFAILGVALPQDLGAGKHNLFQKGRGICLKGFQLEECDPLKARLEAKISCGEAALVEILRWTGGQPFLTQKVCHLLFKEISGYAFNFAPNSLEIAAWVKNLVQRQVIDNWEVQDEPEHLRTLYNRIKQSDRPTSLLRLYGQLLQTGEIEADSSWEQRKLRLTGLTIVRGGRLDVYNRIYATIFNLNWVEKELMTAQMQHLKPASISS